MQIVIKIDENLYKDIYSDAEIMIYGGMRSGKTLLATLLRAIRNGTPLPKGHGDLVDRNDLKYEKYNSYAYAIANADTIIEADKEFEEKEQADKCTYEQTGCGSCKRQLDCPIKAESEVQDANSN